MDIIGILAFIVFIILRAMGESGKKQQEYRRKMEKPAPENRPVATRPGEEDFEELFPPFLQLPWEEASGEKTAKSATADAYESMVDEAGEKEAEGVGDEGSYRQGSLVFTNSEGYAEEDQASEWRAKETAVENKKKAAAEPQLQAIPALQAAFPMEPGDIVRGFIWFELLQPPKAKRGFSAGLRKPG